MCGHMYLCMHSPVFIFCCACVCVHFLSFECEVFELLPPSVVVQERGVGMGWGNILEAQYLGDVNLLCCEWVNSAAFCFQRLQDLMTRMHRENLTRYGELQVLHVCCMCVVQGVCLHACLFMDACVHVYLNSLDKCECVCVCWCNRANLL